MITVSAFAAPVFVRQSAADQALAVDPRGDLVIADRANHRIIRIAHDRHSVGMIAGSGHPGFSGDGGPAIGAALDSPAGVAFDSSGNLYIADSNNHRVRRVTADGTISTVPGTSLAHPIGVSTGSGGELYISDRSHGSGVVWRVSPQGSVMPLAAFESLQAPPAAEVDPGTEVVAHRDGSLYISETAANRIRKIFPNGVVIIYAGTGAPGAGPDGVPARLSALSAPRGMVLDEAGNLYFADSGNHRVRRISPSGIVTTVAGNGRQGLSGDGGPALTASLDTPSSVALDRAGNLYIADMGNGRIRRVAPDGTMSTFSGSTSAAAASQPVPPVSSGVHLGRTEVTVGEYENFVAATHGRMPHPSGYNKNWVNKNYPMINVTLNEARAYCQWTGARLPTEAEWEEAARGGFQAADYPTGNGISRLDANYGAKGIMSVAAYSPNPLGLYDLAGSVAEWTEEGIVKGGSWFDPARSLRVTARGKGQPDKGGNTVGFRCAW